MSGSSRRWAQRTFVLLVLAMLGLMGGVLSLGSAAGLDVRTAAPLQVIVVDVVPPPAEHAVTVIVRRFDGGSDPSEVGNSPTTSTATISHGGEYTATWSRGGTVSCSTLGHDIPEDHVDTIEGTFTATFEVTHEVCTQTGNGTIEISTAAK